MWSSHIFNAFHQPPLLTSLFCLLSDCLPIFSVFSAFTYHLSPLSLYPNYFPHSMGKPNLLFHPNYASINLFFYYYSQSRAAKAWCHCRKYVKTQQCWDQHLLQSCGRVFQPSPWLLDVGIREHTMHRQLWKTTFLFSIWVQECQVFDENLQSFLLVDLNLNTGSRKQREKKITTCILQ